MMALESRGGGGSSNGRIISNLPPVADSILRVLACVRAAGRPVHTVCKSQRTALNVFIHIPKFQQITCWAAAGTSVIHSLSVLYLPFN